MTQDERQDILDLREGIDKALAQTEEQIILYPVDASDEEHRSLINKAIYYRELLKQIHIKLSTAT